MYKKFDIRNYQVGGNVPPIRIEELEIPLTLNDKIRRYYRKKINSQVYKDKLYKLGYAGDHNLIERWLKRDYDKVEDLAKYRDGRIENTIVNMIPSTKRQYEGDRLLPKPDNRSYNNHNTGRNTIYLDNNYRDDELETLAHEYSHSEVNPYDLKNRLNDKEQRILQRELKAPVQRKYHLNPNDPEAKHNYSAYERKADIDAIRAELYINGYHNPATDEYRLYHNNKAWKKKLNRHEAKELLDKIHWNESVERSRKLYPSDKSIFNLMKQISYNNPNTGVNKNKYNV